MALSSAIAQESVSKVSSYISSRRNLDTRLKMAVVKLEFAIERSGKLPITDASLLRRRNMIKSACFEGNELLRTHKQLLEGREEVGQVVMSSSFLRRATRAANRSILSLLGFDKSYLSSSTVEKFEQFAEWADKFLDDVMSGFSLRPYMISNNLVRLLFEWKTLFCGTMKGTFQQSAFIVWVTHSEERGIEASLVYIYNDPKMPEKCFCLKLGLRLSESTDIIGTAIKCLQPLVSQFKVAAELAIGELSQLQATAASNLLELSPSRVDSLVPIKKHFASMSRSYRSDPICCWSNEHGSSGDNTLSSQLSHIYPEEVIFLNLEFHVLLERKYNLRRSSDEAGRSVMLPLVVEVAFAPHFDHGGIYLQLAGLEGSASIEFGSNHDSRSYRRNESRLISIREVLDTVGSTLQSYLHRPDLTQYGIIWLSRHGAAIFNARKPMTRRGAKRKR